MLDAKVIHNMLGGMATQIATYSPTSQSEFQSGLQDGTRYRADGHMELMQRYDTGTASYRMGFDASENHPRAIDPDFAS